MSTVNVVAIEELKLVGLPVNVAFKGGDFSKIDKTKAEFMRRKGEIKHVVRPDRFVSPWYNCEVMFTYFYCLEVDDLSDIPEGMMGFTVPAHTYAAIRYDGPSPWTPDPYEAIVEYRQQHELENDSNGMVLEFYAFDNEAVRADGRLIVDVAVPLKQR